MKKIFDIWGGALVTILISVPTIAAIIQISHEAAKITFVSNHGVVAVVILIGGYALIWKTFTTIDKVAGQLGDVAASATGRARKALSKSASNSLKKRTHEAIEGRRNVRGAGMAVGLMRRGHMADQGGLNVFSRRARSRYRAAEQNMMQKTAASMMKDDDGRAGGDDDAMEIAMQHGMTTDRFEREYAARLTARGVGAAEAQRRAQSAAATVQNSLGAQLGTDAMRVAAYKSLLNSKTSYTDPTGANAQDNWERMVGDGNELMADGLLTSTDVVMAIKQRADRADRSGVGFGTLQSQVERSYERMQQGATRGGFANNAATQTAVAQLNAAGVNVNDRAALQTLRDQRAAAIAAGGPTTAAQDAAQVIADNALVTEAEAKGMRKEALFGTGPGAIVGGRHEGVSALSGVMTENVQENAQNFHAAQAAAAAAGVPDEAAAAVIANQYRAWRAAGNQGPASAQQQASLDLLQSRENYDRELAAIAGRYDAMGQVSPQNATIMANNVMSQMITDPSGQQMTIQAAIEAARSRPRFDEMRREYMAAGMNPAGLAAAVAAGAGTPGAGGPPPVQSDRRLKRNIIPVGSFNGIKLYRFQYLHSDQAYVGVMAQDILHTHSDAVSIDEDGFYRVDYSKLNARMYTLDEWLAIHDTKKRERIAA